MHPNRIILSCTSTKDRIDMLFYMVESIKKQTIKPDIFYVNLSSKDTLLNDIQLKIPSLFETDFIKINWVEDTGSYRKLIPVLSEADDSDIIITADDDILYGQDWIKRLVSLSDKYPERIVCARARDMRKNVFGRWQNYSRWKLIKKPKEDIDILPTGGAGAVYRRSLLDLDFILNPCFMEIAPTTDDLWFRMASLRKNIPVYVEPSIDVESMYLSHKKGLEQINLDLGSNNYIGRILKNTVGITRDWLGINASKNDENWDRILTYSRQFKKQN